MPGVLQAQEPIPRITTDVAAVYLSPLAAAAPLHVVRGQLI